MSTNKTRHAVYNINYHFVWCPKYRRSVLTGTIGDCLVKMIPQLVQDLGGATLELVVRPDHVHLFSSFPPTIAPYQIMHRIKGATSHYLREQFPQLKSRLPSLWTRSYYVGTAGNVSSETIRKYIEAQEGC
jgi:putative transposase